MLLASIAASADFTDPSSGILASIHVQRDTSDDPLAPFIAASADVQDESILDVVSANPRYNGLRLVVDGTPVASAARGPATTFSRSVDQQNSDFQFEAQGAPWGIPQVDPDDANTDPTAPAPTPPPPGRSPKAWGNKTVEVWQRIAASPSTIFETRLHSGRRAQSELDGQILQHGPFKSLEGLDLANTTFCLSLPPFSGFHRGDIIRMGWNNAWRELGVAPADIPVELDCEAGSIVNSLISLNNVKFLDWVNGSSFSPGGGSPGFGAPDGFYARWMPDGSMKVSTLKIKDAPDWTFSEAAGDFDLDSFKEVPPSLPPARLYGTGAIPKQPGSKGGTSEVVTATTFSEVTGLYSPECAASYAGAHAYGDGSYHVDAAFSIMRVGRTEVTITTTDGLKTKQTTVAYAWLAAKAYDPNYSSIPAGSTYTNAYGDHSFRDTPAETWREVSREEIVYSYDPDGTLLDTDTKKWGWAAPESSIRFTDYSSLGVVHYQMLNSPGHWIYSDQTARVTTTETYQPVNDEDDSLAFDASTGIATGGENDTYQLFAPKGAVGVSQIPAGVTVGGVPTPPGPAAGQPSFSAQMGAANVNVAGVLISWSGLPAGAVASIVVVPQSVDPSTSDPLASIRDYGAFTIDPSISGDSGSQAGTFVASGQVVTASQFAPSIRLQIDVTLSTGIAYRLFAALGSPFKLASTDGHNFDWAFSA